MFNVMKSSLPADYMRSPANPAAQVAVSVKKPIPAQATPLGEHFYLFRRSSGKPAKKLIISAHGAYLPGMNLKVPNNTSLVFYAPPGKTLRPPSLGAITREQVEHFETKRPGEQMRNYTLSKYPEDTYPNICYTVNHSGYDVLTVRNRKTPSLALENTAITLKDALTALEHKGLRYEEVHAVFCRNFMFAVNPGDHFAPMRSPL